MHHLQIIFLLHEEQLQTLFIFENNTSLQCTCVHTLSCFVQHCFWRRSCSSTYCSVNDLFMEAVRAFGQLVE